MNNIPNDIYKLFDGHDCNLDNLNEFTENLFNIIYDRFRDYKVKRKFTLRLSNIGKKDRVLWYEANGFDSTLPSPVKFNMLYGDIIEQLMLFLLKEAGYTLTNHQKELTIEGIKGHQDVSINGVVTDIKSASTYNYNKFNSREVLTNDPYGYVAQLSAYAKGKDKAAWLVVDKALGNIQVVELPKEEMIDVPARIQYLKGILRQTTPPPRCYEPEPDGKSGNLKLCRQCAYCPFRFECWKDSNNGQGLRTFKYSNGDKYLVHVEKQPRVVEWEDD